MPRRSNRHPKSKIQIVASGVRSYEPVSGDRESPTPDPNGTSISGDHRDSIHRVECDASMTRMTVGNAMAIVGLRSSTWRSLPTPFVRRLVRLSRALAAEDRHGRSVAIGESVERRGRVVTNERVIMDGGDPFPRGPNRNAAGSRNVSLMVPAMVTSSKKLQKTEAKLEKKRAKAEVKQQKRSTVGGRGGTREGAGTGPSPAVRYAEAVRGIL